MFNLFKPFDMLTINSNGIVAYNPLINYDWSTTTTSGLRYLKDVGSTPTYNASMYFGRGAYFNGVDQRIDITGTDRPSINRSSFSISVNIATHTPSVGYLNFMGTIDVALLGHTSNSIKWLAFSGVSHSLAYPENTLTGLFTLTFDGTTYKAYHNGTLITSLEGNMPYTNANAFCIGGRSQISSYRQATQKDMFIFNRTLTQSEITQSYEQPELFYAMAQADSTCVLNMPMCETSSTVRNYKTGIDHPITNYTTSVRTNAKNLQYGLQTCKFVRDSLGVIQSASNYLECDGVGYADTGWVPRNSMYMEVILYMPKDGSSGKFGANTGHSFELQTNNNFFYYSPTNRAYSLSYIAGYVHVYVEVNAVGVVDMTLNGSVIASKTAVVKSFTNENFYLGKQNVNGDVLWESEIRLFKVHTEPQDPLELYNKAVAKGLLS